jgi:hypothetical protein
VTVALLWWSRISPDGSYIADVLGPSVVAAVGLGLSFVPVTIGAVAGVDEHEAGLASGLINTAQQIGGALGLAILATIANSVTGESFDPVALTDGFEAAFLVGAGFGAVGLILSLLLIKSSDSRAMIETGEPEPEPAAAS